MYFIRYVPCHWSKEIGERSVGPRGAVPGELGPTVKKIKNYAAALHRVPLFRKERD